MASPIGDRDRGDEGRGRTALVTGASSGIGRAFAELLAAKGYDLVVVARRAERLDQFAAEVRDRWNVEVTTITEDLADPEAPARVLTSLADGGAGIDFLVNNAGNSRYGRFDELPWELHAGRLQLMVATPMRLAHGVLPGMVERGWGRIVNVGSLAGVVTGFPGDITYAAIKKMVEKWSEGLDAEFRELGVRATVCVPGPTTTEIFEVPGSAGNVASEGFFSRFEMSPDYVARKTYAAAIRGKPLIVPGSQNSATAVVMEHAPKPISRRLSRAFAKMMKEKE